MVLGRYLLVGYLDLRKNVPTCLQSWRTLVPSGARDLQHIYIYIYVYVYVYVNMYTLVYIYIFVCVRVLVYAYMDR